VTGGGPTAVQAGRPPLGHIRQTRQPTRSAKKRAFSFFHSPLHPCCLSPQRRIPPDKASAAVLRRPALPCVDHPGFSDQEGRQRREIATAAATTPSRSSTDEEFHVFSRERERERERQAFGPVNGGLRLSRSKLRRLAGRRTAEAPSLSPCRGTRGGPVELIGGREDSGFEPAGQPTRARPWTDGPGPY